MQRLECILAKMIAFENFIIEIDILTFYITYYNETINRFDLPNAEQQLHALQPQQRDLASS